MQTRNTNLTIYEISLYNSSGTIVAPGMGEDGSEYLGAMGYFPSLLYANVTVCDMLWQKE